LIYFFKPVSGVAADGAASRGARAVSRRYSFRHADQVGLSTVRTRAPGL